MKNKEFHKLAIIFFTRKNHHTISRKYNRILSQEANSWRCGENVYRLVANSWNVALN